VILRRLLIALSAFAFLAASPCLAAIGTPVSLGGVTTSSTGMSASFNTTTNSPAGNAIFIAIQSSISATAMTVSDTINTYSTPVAYGSSSIAGTEWIAYCLNCLSVPSGTAITVSWSSVSARVNAGAISVSGIATSSALDVHAAGTSGTGTTATQTSPTLAQAAELMIGVTDISYPPGTYTEASGFTTLPQWGNGFNFFMNWAYQITSATTPVTYTTSWTQTGKTYQPFLFSLKGASGITGSGSGLLLTGVGN
jgi:hypothetical protein